MAKDFCLTTVSDLAMVSASIELGFVEALNRSWDLFGELLGEFSKVAKATRRVDDF